MGRHATPPRQRAGPEARSGDGDPDATPVPAALLALYRRLSPARRRAVAPLLALMAAGAAAEVMTIGALLPFLAVIADPQGSPVLGYVAPLLDRFGASAPPRAVYALTGLFALAALLTAGLRLVLLWAGNSFVNGMAYELATGLYDSMLHRPYAFHTRSNSGEVIAAVNKVEALTWSVLHPLMNAGVALVIAAFIVAGLIVIDPVVALTAGLGFAAIYLAATRATRPRLQANSGIIAAAQGRRVRVMQEGLGGIRDVLIDQSQPVFTEAYERAEAGLRDGRTYNAFLANAPRFLVEALGMVMIAAMAVVVTGRPGGLVEAIPVLGALALGAQRLLPLIQQVYGGWAQTMGHRQVLVDVARLIGAPAPRPACAGPPLPFRDAIRLDRVGFSYGHGRAPALSGVSLVIPKGARVGIAGRTGSGKSTLMDLVLGLLEPGEGEIRIDGVALTAGNRAAWQMNIAHVPQAIYLADASVAANIAFGVRPEAIDRERVARAAEQAELTQVIAGLPRGLDTFVGERGIQLSGGQRQRIGIARALYKQASVLVFDEATSALDTDTEAAVMAAIARLDRSLTILIIAHRLSTLEGCDVVVRLEGGRVVAVEGRGAMEGTWPREERRGSVA